MKIVEFPNSLLGITLDEAIFFALLSFGAAFVNGAIGYGYSSISIPIITLFVSITTANPAYVLIELILNLVMLVLVGPSRIRATFRRALPIVTSLLPGVIVGAVILGLLTKTAQAELSNEVKFIAYAALLPLVLLALAGFRKAIKGELRAGIPLGVGTGLLYSLTTISGPPIALFWNNQGLSKDEFKAAVVQIRVAESGFTFLLYFLINGFYSGSTATPVFGLFSIIAPSVLIGIPIGMFAIKRLSVETFRRFSMNLNAVIISFGISKLLGPLFGLSQYVSYAFWFAIVALTLGILSRYMKSRKGTPVKVGAVVEDREIASKELVPAGTTLADQSRRNDVASAS